MCHTKTVCLFLFIALFSTPMLAKDSSYKMSDTTPSTTKTGNADVMSDKIPRGQMLYENHCRVCHDSTVHVRENHKAKSTKDLFYWVNRWSGHLKLQWSEDDKMAVVKHLGKTFYHFSAQQ